jgi:RimJ/RimL family protein N-acetyltransferase
MRHDLRVDGHAFRLRPIADSDAQLVLQLRCDPDLRRFIHATPPRLSDQLAWLASYYERPGDYYFVVERRSDLRAEGLIGIYEIDSLARTAEWGRWILQRGSLAAPESAWLIYRCAFEQLSLDRVYCRTLVDNAAVVSFHDSCGISQTRHLPQHFELEGHKHDAIEHTLERLAWGEVASTLEPIARAVARRLERA